MKSFLLILLIFTLTSCSLRKSTPVERNQIKRQRIAKIPEDERLKQFISRKFSRKGKFSTVSDGDITTERYVRNNTETVITLEKGELRTETEKNNTGRVITRTYQDDVMTSLSVTTPRRSTLVLLDKDKKFVHKIITKEGDDTPDCYSYNGKAVLPLTTTECVGLIPGFE